ncbi:hypothetical protein B0T20DRAFT_469849 [Sordaria brevicollis]|uniref:Uncharacterized protein n=1 Tax=Sordaria brevicollis TaxID=83679 RepID=A0AAE0PCW6_SORBR|nr:hypothetical protein B0T20DRAFT_469849 [Sordaria brevicollis]
MAGAWVQGATEERPFCQARKAHQYPHSKGLNPRTKPPTKRQKWCQPFLFAVGTWQAGNLVSSGPWPRPRNNHDWITAPWWFCIPSEWPHPSSWPYPNQAGRQVQSSNVEASPSRHSLFAVVQYRRPSQTPFLMIRCGHSQQRQAELQFPDSHRGMFICHKLPPSEGPIFRISLETATPTTHFEITSRTALRHTSDGGSSHAKIQCVISAMAQSLPPAVLDKFRSMASWHPACSGLSEWMASRPAVRATGRLASAAVLFLLNPFCNGKWLTKHLIVEGPASFGH